MGKNLGLTNENIRVSAPIYEVRLVVTGACNHSCVYCGPFSDGKYTLGYGLMSINQIKEVSGLVRENSLHVQITGGEPSLRNDLSSIVTILADEGCKDIGMTTNGSYFNLKVAKQIFQNGLKDLHIHVPSLDRIAYQKTIRKEIDNELNNILDATFEAKRKNIRVEFNTPITEINLPTIRGLMDFCYKNSVNLKLIEEVNLENKQIKEDKIEEIVSCWLNSKSIHIESVRIPGKYGYVYQLANNLSFRIAPATSGLVNHLNGGDEKLLFDGRYWIGGKNGNYLYTPTYFSKPEEGNFKDLEENLNKSIFLCLGDKNEKK